MYILECLHTYRLFNSQALPSLVPAAEEFERRRKNKLFSVFFLLKTDKAVCYIIITVNPKNWRLIRLYLYAGKEEEWADRWNNQFQSTLGAISRHRASQDRFSRKISFVKVCMHVPLLLWRIYIDRLNSVQVANILTFHQRLLKQSKM